MFNTRLGDDLAAAREIASIAIREASVPGQISSGNASGSITTASNAVDYGVTNEGVGPDGTAFFSCLTDVDSTDIGAFTEK